MWRSIVRVMAATAAFGAVHSALASRTVKRATARRFGERNRNGLYRVFYLAQSVVTFGMLAAYIRRQPSRELYHAEGRRRILGPFAWSRHPLNFAPLPLFWLWPRMTSSLLAFNTAATIYLVVGSLHEEARLREVFGNEYDAYLNSGISYYIPVLDRSGLAPTDAVASMRSVPE